MAGARRRRHRQLAPMQLVVPPVGGKGRIVAVGQDRSRRHCSVLHASRVTFEMLTAMARCRQCSPLDRLDYTEPGAADLYPREERAAVTLPVMTFSPF